MRTIGAIILVTVLVLTLGSPAWANGGPGHGNGNGHDDGNGSVTAEGGTAINRVKNVTDVGVDVTNRNVNDVTGVNLGVTKGIVTGTQSADTAASSDNAVDINTTIGGDSTEYADESVYNSIATSPQKTEVQLGLPGLGGITLSDPDRFTMYNQTLAATVALYEAGLITKEEAAESAGRQLKRLEKQSNRPNGRTLFNAFGLVW